MYNSDIMEGLEKNIKALRLCSRNLLSSCFKKLILRRLFVISLRISFLLYEQIIIIISLQQKILCKTKVAFDYYLTRELNNISLLLWSHNIKKKVFLKWVSCMKEKARERELKLQALKWWNTCIDRRYLNIWIKYKDHRKWISQGKQFADDLKKFRLIANSLTKWNLKYNEISAIKSIVSDATTLFERRRLRIYFYYWRTYTFQIIDMRSKVFQAQEFYHIYLKNKAFTHMRSYHNNKKKYKQLHEVARTFEKALYTQDYWRKWMNFMEKQESSTYHSFYRKAYLFHRRMTLNRCFLKVINYLQIRRRKADLFKKKLKFSVSLVGNVYLQLWKIKWEEIQYTALIEKEGIAVYSYNTICKTLIIWRRRWLQYDKILKLEHFAISYTEEKLMNRMLHKWIAWKNRKNKIRHFTTQAMNYNERRMKLLLMGSWKNYLLLKEWKRSQYIISENIHKNNMKRRAFCKLMVFKAFMINQNTKANINADEIKMKKVNKVFHEWRSIIHDRKKTDDAINNFCQIQDLRRTCLYFKKWLTFILTRKRKGVLYTKMKSFLASWNKEILKSYLKEWNKTYIHDQYSQQLEKKACDYFKCNLERNHFLSWKIYHSNRKQKRMVKEKSIEVQLSCFISRMLCEWYEFYILKILENNRMISSVIKWKQLTQQKVIKGWHRVTEEKKIKRKQYSDAANLHSKLLLKMGVTLLLRTSILKEEQRRASHQQKYMQMSARQFQIALKYSELWRRKLHWKLSYQNFQHFNDLIKQKKILGPNFTSDNEDNINTQLHVDSSEIQERKEDFKTRAKPRIPYFITVKEEKKLRRTNPNFSNVNN